MRGAAERDVDKNVSDFCQDGIVYPSLLTNVLDFLVEYALWLHCLQVFQHDQRFKSLMHLNVISGCVNFIAPFVHCDSRIYRVFII